MKDKLKNDTVNSNGVKFDDKTIKKILLKGNYITEEDVKNADDFATTHQVSFIGYLLQENLITKDLLGQAIAESFKVPYADLNSAPPAPLQVQKIPEETAKKYHAVIFAEEKNKTVVATDNPEDPTLLPELEKLFVGRRLSIVYSLTEDINASFVHYQKPLETRFSKIIESKGRVAPELLEEIFDDALVYHASDIHFEPRQKDVLVRFRIDGVLQETGRIPKEYYENILNRIKVQSGLRIDEHFAAQDGSLRYEPSSFKASSYANAPAGKKDSVVVDLRTSVVPTVEGEKVALRVLSAYVQGFSLGDLGLSPAHQQILEQAATKPFGMILVAGPTGSGKTTTLYALLKLVNSPEVNITTIEDPVEYRVLGVNQIQINPLTNLTFAKGLRSIVRQDPDIILVGEIRDEETAEIAVNAALTGHLLYSTFHANDAATAIPRLLDMGIEPFLLASTLEVIVAQRLVRKICEHCRHSVTKSANDWKTPQLRSVMPYLSKKSITLYEGKKCEMCGYTGYKGRTAIFEFIQITPEMRNLILHSPSTKEIWQLASKDGSKTLFEDGIEKVKTGVTTIEELLRVAEPPQKSG
ncbi:MAG: GspE/PulE family protein [Patescibacteria group bacterium]|nr:GspE/PulE family protein [Patescibacteria group bacterium]